MHPARPGTATNNQNTLVLQGFFQQLGVKVPVGIVQSPIGGSNDLIGHFSRFNGYPSCVLFMVLNFIFLSFSKISIRHLQTSWLIIGERFTLFPQLLRVTIENL